MLTQAVNWSDTSLEAFRLQSPNGMGEVWERTGNTIGGGRVFEICFEENGNTNTTTDDTFPSPNEFCGAMFSLPGSMGVVARGLAEFVQGDSQDFIEAELLDEHPLVQVRAFFFFFKSEFLGRQCKLIEPCRTGHVRTNRN
jgi:hypothetical protein